MLRWLTAGRGVRKAQPAQRDVLGGAVAAAGRVLGRAADREERLQPWRDDGEATARGQVGVSGVGDEEDGVGGRLFARLLLALSSWNNATQLPS